MTSSEKCFLEVFLVSMIFERRWVQHQSLESSVGL